MRLQDYGDYAFHFGCFDDDDHVINGRPAPVHIDLHRMPGLPPPPFPVDHLFGQRRHELDANDGPMGMPTAAAAQFAVPRFDGVGPGLRTRTDDHALRAR